MFKNFNLQKNSIKCVIGGPYKVECSWPKKGIGARRNDMKRTSPVAMTLLSLKVGSVYVIDVGRTYSAVTLF